MKRVSVRILEIIKLFLTVHFQPTPSVLTLSSIGQRQRFSKVPVMFLVNRGPKTSLSAPNWCLDCRTMESTTYKPATLYSGLHFIGNMERRDRNVTYLVRMKLMVRARKRYLADLFDKLLHNLDHVFVELRKTVKKE